MIVNEKSSESGETACRPKGCSKKFGFYAFKNAKSLRNFIAEKSHYLIGFFKKNCHSKYYTKTLIEWGPEIEVGKLVYLEIFELFLKARNDGLDDENTSEKNKGCFQVVGSAVLFTEKRTPGKGYKMQCILDMLNLRCLLHIQLKMYNKLLN